LGPWHWAHANWTKSWAPAATFGLTDAGLDANVVAAGDAPFGRV
jgi:hypothetical protein